MCMKQRAISAVMNYQTVNIKARNRFGYIKAEDLNSVQYLFKHLEIICIMNEQHRLQGTESFLPMELLKSRLRFGLQNVS